jgi:hypothetical protein
LWSAKLGVRSQEPALRVAQAQRSYTAEVIDRSEKIEPRQRSKRGVTLTEFRVRALYDALSPRIGFCVGQGKGKW